LLSAEHPKRLKQTDLQNQCSQFLNGERIADFAIISRRHDRPRIDTEKHEGVLKGVKEGKAASIHSIPRFGSTASDAAIAPTAINIIFNQK